MESYMGLREMKVTKMTEKIIKNVAEMESPPRSPVNELLDTYDDNYHSIEKVALDFLAASEISIFNGLRNISPQGCLKALDRISSQYVSDGDFVSYFVSLAVMTEYICIAYRNPHLYDTFLVALGTKFTDMLFEKLCQRWMQVYRNHNLSNYVKSAQFEACFNILKYSVNQFPESFASKCKLDDTICTGEEVLRLLEQRSSLLSQWSTAADLSPLNGTPKFTQPTTKLYYSTMARNADRTTIATNHEVKIPMRNPETNLSATKTKGWMFEREVGQMTAANERTKMITTNFSIQLPAKNHETNASVSKPCVKTKSKGWMFERVVLQSSATNAGTTTVITNYETKNLQSKTSVSTPTLEKKKKSQGWVFERQVLQTPSRTTTQSIPKVPVLAEKPSFEVSKPASDPVYLTSEVTASCLKRNHDAILRDAESVSVETIDLTEPVMISPSETNGSQVSTLILKPTDVLNTNGSTGSLEPPKKKIKNAFDVLMRRDKSKKIVSSTSVRVA